MTSPYGPLLKNIFWINSGLFARKIIRFLMVLMLLFSITSAPGLFGGKNAIGHKKSAPVFHNMMRLHS